MTLKRFLLFYFLVLFVVFLVVTLSPIAFGPDQNIVSQTGTIVFLDFEGGFYGIFSDDGEHYDPINLSKEFQVDGLRVRFEVKILQDVVSFHMWGKVVSISHIEKLE
jgi:hypothetical protein